MGNGRAKARSAMPEADPRQRAAVVSYGILKHIPGVTDWTRIDFNAKSQASGNLCTPCALASFLAGVRVFAAARDGCARAILARAPVLHGRAHAPRERLPAVPVAWGKT